MTIKQIKELFLTDHYIQQGNEIFNRMLDEDAEWLKHAGFKSREDVKLVHIETALEHCRADMASPRAQRSM